MRVSCYSSAWGLATPAGSSFDVRDALANWAVYADEISVATGDEESRTIVLDTARALGVLDRMVVTPVSYDRTGADPFAYGKTENAALQACTGDLLIQQNLDERLVADPARFPILLHALKGHPDHPAFWIPNLDLYGSPDRCILPCSRKWMVHLPGLQRGAVSFGLKADGRPDYNRTSTDELLDAHGNLVHALSIIQDLSLASLKEYVADGWPLTMHIGYISLGNRISRSRWWSDYWVRATGGDENQHPKTVEEMAARATVPHGLPLWPTISVPSQSGLDSVSHLG